MGQRIPKQLEEQARSLASVSKVLTDVGGAPRTCKAIGHWASVSHSAQHLSITVATVMVTNKIRTENPWRTRCVCYALVRVQPIMASKNDRAHALKLLCRQGLTAMRLWRL